MSKVKEGQRSMIIIKCAMEGMFDKNKSEF